MKRLVVALGAATAILVGCGGHGAPAAHPPGWGHPPKGTKFALLPPTQPLTNVATMYDTVTLSTVPSNPFATAGYTSGLFVTYLPLRARFPQAHTISIAIDANHRANCLDVEPGDATPEQAPGWVKRGGRCVYSSFWEFVERVRPLLARAGISRNRVFEWDADYLGCPRLDATFDATQCTDTALGRNLDESTVKLYFLTQATPPYVFPKPKPKPTPTAQRLKLEREIRELRADLVRHQCRTVHGKKAYKLCPRWGGEGRVRHAELNKLVGRNVVVR